MIHLYKQDNGNLCFFAAESAEQERLARAAGYKPLNELFPDGNPTSEDLDRIAEEETARRLTRRGRK